MNQYLTAMQVMENILGEMAEPMEGFRRKTYPDQFDKLYQKMLPAFDAIEELYHTVAEPEEMLSNMAKALTDSAQGLLDKCKRKSQKESEMIGLNMKMAAYIFPCILRYKGDSSQPLTDQILKHWKEAFPKSNIQAATYETIEKGFHRKFCYVTTAVCQTFGKPDDCYELQLFRSFRDGYMSEQPGGEDLIRHYYDIAPTIVKHINQQQEAAAVYSGIWEKWLAPCMNMIETGQNEACLEHYVKMVETLEEIYF